MSTNQEIAIVMVVIVVAVGVLVLLRLQKSRRLRERFGPEYDRTVAQSGNTRAGEERLAKLERRVEKFHIHDLEPGARERFMEKWRDIQGRFVDDPNTSVGQADQLLTDVMSARGYPVADFDQQAADLSVHHPRVVEHYRAGHDIALRHQRGHATTEDLRVALIHYRQLFDELVGESSRVHAGASVR